MDKVIKQIEHHCHVTYHDLLLIKESDFVSKPDPNRWSKKEILGHLLDSAANNHQRFIKSQYLEVPHIVYDQNQWVSLSNYQQYPLAQLLNLWRDYNLHIVHILRHMPPQVYTKKCKTSEVFSLDFIINDYLSHLEHHLRQILAP